jgi:hypothetical protein
MAAKRRRRGPWVQVSLAIVLALVSALEPGRRYCVALSPAVSSPDDDSAVNRSTPFFEPQTFYPKPCKPLPNAPIPRASRAPCMLDHLTSCRTSNTPRCTAHLNIESLLRTAVRTPRRSLFPGMLQPSGGSAAVEGLDVATSMAAIRRSLGVCPQFDILWPRLTVAEHLTTYWALKGGGGDGGGAAGARAAVAAAAAEVGGLEARGLGARGL